MFYSRITLYAIPPSAFIRRIYMNYSIFINNEEIPVSEDVYRAYWKGARKERYFAESDIHNHVFSYDALDNEDMNGEDIFADDTSIEDQVIKSIEEQQLHTALSELNAEDYNIIYRLYFCNTSLRKLSQEMGIALSTLHYRHHAILHKLQSCMNNKRSLQMRAN